VNLVPSEASSCGSTAGICLLNTRAEGWVNFTWPKGSVSDCQNQTGFLLRPAAVADLHQAYEWYQAKRPGLGEEFLQAVRASVERPVAAPAAHSAAHREARRILVRQFAYGLFFSMVDETVERDSGQDSSAGRLNALRASAGDPCTRKHPDSASEEAGLGAAAPRVYTTSSR
jgi:toxin ParE1/3/4